MSLINLPRVKNQLQPFIEAKVLYVDPFGKAEIPIGIMLHSGEWNCMYTPIHIKGMPMPDIQYLGNDIARLVASAMQAGYKQAQEDIRTQLGL